MALVIFNIVEFLKYNVWVCVFVGFLGVILFFGVGGWEAVENSLLL